LHLDSAQEKMLRGELGEAKQFAMEIVSKVGDAVGADDLVPIKSAHVLAHYSSLHDAGVEVLDLRPVPGLQLPQRGRRHRLGRIFRGRVRELGSRVQI